MRKLSDRQGPCHRPLALESLEDRTVPSFLAPTNFSVGLRPDTTTTADLTGDGALDIVVVNRGQHPTYQSSLSVLRGKGDGTFHPAVNTPLLGGNRFSTVAVGDFNSDGKADVAVNSSVNNAVEVRLGNGDGSFRSRQLVFVGNSPSFVAVGDLDGNGKLDLVTANEGSNTISVLRGNGDGTFQPRIDQAVGAGPLAVAVHDFNGDGKLDVVSANGTGRTLTVLRGNGDGTFGTAQTYANGTPDLRTASVAVGDTNGDGKADIVYRLQSAPYPFGTRLGVLLGRGDGTFQSTPLGATQFGLQSLAVGDFDNDGRSDVAAAFRQSPSGTLGVFHGSGSGALQGPQSVPTGGAYAFGVAVGDFNGDGRLDLVATNTFSDSVGVMLNAAPAGAALAPTLTSGRSGVETTVPPPSEAIKKPPVPSVPVTLDPRPTHGRDRIDLRDITIGTGRTGTPELLDRELA